MFFKHSYYVSNFGKRNGFFVVDFMVKLVKDFVGSCLQIMVS